MYIKQKSIGLAVLVFTLIDSFRWYRQCSGDTVKCPIGKDHYCLQFYFGAHGSVVDHPGPWFFS